MNAQEHIAEQFEGNRKHLLAVAYRMLGSWSEAEDAVQEAWLRLSLSDSRAIENLGGWLTTVVSRICLDMLRTRKSRREEPVEAHSSHSFMNHPDSDPEQEALLADSVGLAMLVVLGNLNPSERVTFVLHDIFAIPFTEIAAILGKSETAARQLASRARRRVRGDSPEEDKPALAYQRELIEAFLAAARDADFDRLLAVLDPDVVLRDDRQGGELRITHGAQHLAQQVAGRIQASQPALVNGSVGVIVAPGGRLQYVLQYAIRQGKIAEIDLISDSIRISRLDLKLLDN
ncbi:sigma-70 family RNA polymerase sigma factor [Paenibacillus sp. J22TS3]|uniref:sigma-70 family RNA polymerase sigma factor n=1 Tax=Paenibacillus sp. J22TS3 TaxID=2807192 RepID=UPI001B1E9C54|nr:sigma-70 family RNA polymerase sigma factor [Paenibacillus sp. J22TS3]GIP24609.1 DNA-directed RNA polymerase sigma-70 factor [Paenibacillus sp. J22TS3]